MDDFVDVPVRLFRFGGIARKEEKSPISACERVHLQRPSKAAHSVGSGAIQPLLRSTGNSITCYHFYKPGEAHSFSSRRASMGLSGPIDPSASAGESSQRYAARMVYLTEDDEGAIFGNTTLEPMGRTLKPPGLFMSRHQARADSALCAHRSTKRTDGVDPLRGVRAQAEKKPLVTRRNEAAARGKRKSDHKRPTVTEVFPDDWPENWRRVKEAGVSFWVNDVTGVATDECPHESLRHLEDSKRAMTVGVAAEGSQDVFGSVQHDGTGALVYDSTEFEQAMRVLDGGLPGVSYTKTIKD